MGSCVPGNRAVSCFPALDPADRERQSDSAMLPDAHSRFIAQPIGPVTAKLCNSAKAPGTRKSVLHPAQLWTESAFGEKLGQKVVAIAPTLTGVRDPLDRRSVKSSPPTRRTPPGLPLAREMARTHSFAVTRPNSIAPCAAVGPCCRQARHDWDRLVTFLAPRSVPSWATCAIIVCLSGPPQVPTGVPPRRGGNHGDRAHLTAVSREP